MGPDAAQPLKSGDLTMLAESGEVRNEFAETVRLGPVNMRILVLLASRAGEVVPRNELIEAVWKNQTVSDDALTRCISEIRATLSELSKEHQYIQTLPKRGYRWNPRRPPARSGSGNAIGGDPPHRDVAARHVIVRWIRRGLLYVLIAAVTSSLGIWLINELSRPAVPIVVIMPIQSNQDQQAPAAEIERGITEFLLEVKGVAVLSRSAVASRPPNPFPYFYYEFGARWLIECQVRDGPGDLILSIDLVDARAGIVLLQSTQVLPADGELDDVDIEEMLESILAYIDSQQDR